MLYCTSNIIDKLTFLKVPYSTLLKEIIAIPLEELKIYLSDKHHCQVFSHLIFEENEFEDIEFWNRVKSHGYTDYRVEKYDKKSSF